MTTPELFSYSQKALGNKMAIARLELEALVKEDYVLSKTEVCIWLRRQADRVEQETFTLTLTDKTNQQNQNT